MPDTARMDIYGDIGGDEPGAIQARDFVAQLKDMDATAIDLHVSSAGGSVDDGHLMYNAILNHPASFTAYIDGIAASMATVICMACDRVVMAENATWMMHNPMTVAVGNKRDMDAAGKRLATLTDSMVRAYMRHSNADEAQIRAWLDAETWMSAEEAMAAGFVHEISAPQQMAAHVDLSRFEKIPGRIAAILVAPRPADKTAKQEAHSMATEPETAAPAAPESPEAPDYQAECDKLRAELDALKNEQAEAVVAARAAAVEAERQRIADVQALVYPGAEGLIAECVAKGVSKADAALKLVAFEKARRSDALAKLEADAPEAVADTEAAALKGDVNPLDLDEAGQRAHFAATASLHEEHLSADHYVGWCKLQNKQRGVN